MLRAWLPEVTFKWLKSDHTVKNPKSKWGVFGRPCLQPRMHMTRCMHFKIHFETVWQTRASRTASQTLKQGMLDSQGGPWTQQEKTKHLGHLSNRVQNSENFKFRSILALESKCPGFLAGASCSKCTPTNPIYAHELAPGLVGWPIIPPRWLVNWPDRPIQATPQQ